MRLRLLLSLVLSALLIARQTEAIPGPTPRLSASALALDGRDLPRWAPGGPTVAVLGVGVAALGGALAFQLLRADSLSGCRVEGPIAACDSPASLARAAGGEFFAWGATVMLVTGLVSLAVGGAMWGLDASGHGPFGRVAVSHGGLSVRF
jgi:hypothetical protein